MVRRAAVALVLAGIALGSVRAAAGAQTLARLTVTSFDLTSDTAAPKAGAPFHLLLTLRVRERVQSIENISLPMLAQLQLLGDERQTIAGARGTQYRETIGVIAANAGTLAIAPATLQAIDARDGKPKEWYTNGLTLHVTGGAADQPGAATQLVVGALWFALHALLWLTAAACAIAVLAVVVVGSRRRRLRRLQPAEQPIAVTPLVRSPRQQAEDALAVLRTERSRSAAVAVRGAIWRMAGASEGETLADVLRRTESSDSTMRGVLIALERSAFTHDEDLRAAIDDACDALDRYIEVA